MNAKHFGRVAKPLCVVACTLIALAPGLAAARPGQQVVNQPPVAATPLATGPGWQMTRLAPITPEQADAAMRARGAPPPVDEPRVAESPRWDKLNVLPAANSFAAPGAPTTVAELARSLRNDPDLIYQYVRNNIEFYPKWGIHKGAVGALIDGTGTAFDQALLLRDTLRAAGFTEADLVRGEVALPAAIAASWLGVQTANLCTWTDRLSNGGTPIKPPYGSGTGCATLTHGQFSHVWVRVKIAGTDYVFDPSIKPRAAKARPNLATITGYNRTTFLTNARAGATVTADSVLNLNRANVRANLTTYANNLATHIRTNNPHGALHDVLGGAGPITPDFSTTPQRLTALPTCAPLNTTVPAGLCQVAAPVVVKEADPVAANNLDNYRVDLRVQFLGIDRTYTSHALYGRRLTITFNASNVPELRVDGALEASGTTAASPGTNVSVAMTVTHRVNNMTQSFTQSITAGPSNVYVISQGWGPTSAATLAHFQRRLAQARATNAAPGSEAVMGPTVAVLSAQWLAQVSANQDILDRLAGSWTLSFNAVGIAGYANSTTYVDLPGNQSTTVTADRSSFYPQFLASGFPLSVLESASVQQVSGVADAASTVSLIDKAVAGGVRVFNAVSANYGTVRPSLLAGPGCSPYAASFDSAVNGGRRLVVPAECDLAADQWRGAGWFATFFNGSSGSVTAAISGGNPANLTPPAFTPPSPVFNGALSAAPGDFTMATTDISVGAGEFPYALSLERRYSSGSSLDDGVFGRGWSHNLGGSARASEAALRALGEGSALDAVANIVSNMVALDLMTEANQPLVNVVAASVGAKWASEQLEDTAVSVRLGTSTEVFMRLPDGTYNPPRGSSARLTLVDGKFRYETKDRTVLDFSAAGELVDYTLSNGVRARFAYTNGRLTSVSNSLGRSITLAINNTTQRIDSATAKGSTADPGRTVSYGYTGNTLTRFTNAMAAFGNTSAQNTTYAYDGNTRLCRVFGALEPTVPLFTNNYDALGRLSVQVGDAAAGRVTRRYYAGSRTEVETPGAGTVNYTDCLGAAASVAVTGNAVRTVSFHNWQGLPVRSIDPVGRVSTTDYDGAGRPTRITYPEGNRTEYTYDDATCANAEKRCTHNVLTEVQHPKPGSTLAPLTTTYTYEGSFNKVASVTNPRGQKTDFTYHAAHGGSATVTPPAPATGAERPQVSMTYAVQTATGWPNFHLLSTETQRITGAANTTTTTWTYSAANGWVPATVVVDSGTGKLALTTAYTYDAIGNLTGVNGPRTDVTDTVTTAYDNLRRVTQVTDALGKVSRAFYDVNGRAVRSARQLGTGWMVSCTRYSRSNEPTRAWGPLRMTVDTACPTEAAPVPITDRTYDKAGRLATETVALTTAEGGSRTTAYVYYADGRLKDVTHASGTTAATTGTYTYTLNGLSADLRDGANNVTTYLYDGFDRLNALVYPTVAVGSGQSNASDREEYTYDANGNRLTHRLRNGNTVSFSYDNLDRLTGRTYPTAADSVTYTYDLLGRTLSANQSVHAISAVWDNAGRLTSTTAGGRTLAYQYDNAGNRTRTTWPDSFFVTTTYDALNRPASIKENGTVNLVTSYAYDDLSRRTTVTLGNGTTSTYTWGDQGVMSGLTHNLAGTATDVTFTLSRNQALQVNNRTISTAAYNWLPSASPTRTYTPNGLNQYTAARGATLTYDTRGNLSGDGTWTWGYNDLNQLVTASRSGTSVTLAYDGSGRLRQEVANGSTTAFLYDGANRVAEYNNTGTLLRRHVHGPGIDEPIVSYDGSGTALKTWLYADHLGSIVGAANGTGTATQVQGYGPFGEPGSTTGTRFKYTGQAYVESLGLHYYKARFYSHSLGRFLQPDPAGYADGPNLYAYVGNNPINFVDPTGMTAEVHHGGFSGTPQTPQAVVLAASANVAPQVMVLGATTDTQSNWVDRIHPDINRLYTNLTDAEKQFLASNPHMAIPFWQAQQAADSYSANAARAFPNKKDQGIAGDGAGNALRHASWNAFMVKNAYQGEWAAGLSTVLLPALGVTFLRDQAIDRAVEKAREFANAHEDSPKNSTPKVWPSRMMDYYNNQVGREIAAEILRSNPFASEQQIFEAVRGALETNQLRQLTPTVERELVGPGQ